jgi:hypothetical protein
VPYGFSCGQELQTAPFWPSQKRQFWEAITALGFAREAALIFRRQLAVLTPQDYGLINQLGLDPAH